MQASVEINVKVAGRLKFIKSLLSAEDLMEKLDDYVSSIHEERPGLVKKVRHSEQLGLTQARLSGWKAAVGDVVAILDAHIEVHVQWLV